MLRPRGELFGPLCEWLVVRNGEKSRSMRRSGNGGSPEPVESWNLGGLENRKVRAELRKVFPRGEAGHMSPEKKANAADWRPSEVYLHAPPRQATREITSVIRKGEVH